ncbi:DUF4270 family protein [Winogradskyella psychrotolerans]|uniref:DUF4270 family protein n=1 Tax=Winogradskyella psychrotolerans TaxID=1344585 RepID=UPI001C07CE68|nr:DUF4270 family protein [Winogradskyella psychrotolerans]MBU2929410.1 DUF4270 domain-containing protein [Winogradskyella psychrotolerans]
MLKSFLKLFTAITILMVIISCSADADSESLVAGEDFTGTNIRVLSIDTFEVRLSTMKFDSITTSTSGRLLIGQYNDDDMGLITTSTNVQLSPSAYYLDNDAVLDSVGLVLGYDTYYYNDTTQVATLNIHKLTDKMTTDDTYFYNTTETSYEETPLLTKSYYPSPSKDSLFITLPYSFGEELFNDIRENIITDQESLYQMLKGFTIMPSNADDGSIIGFSTDSDSSYLRFYYTIPDELETDEYTYDMTINTYYNHIESDVTGLPLEDITDQEFNLTSTESGNISYNQAGTGYVTRIEFPTIKDLYNIGSEGTILDATLYIEPNTLSHSDIQPLSETLLLYTIDQNNDLASQISNSVDVVTATTTNEDSEFNQVAFTVPVIDFIDLKLNESPITEDALIMIPTDYNSTVNKIIFNDSQRSNFNTKLVITYAVYE